MRSDGLDYQNIPYQKFRTDTENLNKNSIISLYQDTQHHTYQNITKKATKVQYGNYNESNTHRTTPMIQDLGSNQINLEKLHITTSIANGLDDDGLYEICGMQYPCLELNRSNQNTIISQCPNFNTQSNSLNSTYIGITEYNSKFLVLFYFILYRIIVIMGTLAKNFNECI